MTGWILLLTPILVLPVVLLLPFVGCQPFGSTAEDPAPTKPPETQPDPGAAQTPPATPGVQPPTTPPRYRDYILGIQPNPGLVKNTGVVPNGADVIAYWRLVDAPASPTALDQKAFQDGAYKEGHKLDAIPITATAAGSEGRNPAHFTTGENSLVDSDPTVKCRFFDGGYVLVPYKPGLYADQFTLEAWVATGALAAGYEHTLFDAGGRYASPAGSPVSERGFRIYANRDGRWQVRLAPSTADLFPMPILVPLGARTHVALTVANSGPGGVAKTATLYVDGKIAGTANIASYAPPHDAPFFIGVENTTRSPTAGINLRNPVLCRVQEVVMHRKALSKEEIENHVDINRS